MAGIYFQASGHQYAQCTRVHTYLLEFSRNNSTGQIPQQADSAGK